MTLPVPQNFIGAHKTLTLDEVKYQASVLRCSTAIVHAFSDIESAGSGFLPTGEPKILFEARPFHLLTGGRFDQSHPNVSSPVWDRSLYGAPGVHQYHRLREAMALDRIAALESCSIGRYQLMGSNFRMVGYASIDDLWGDFCDAESMHLRAFTSYCSKAGMAPVMRADPPDFVRLAIAYNGPGERANGYDEKLRAAFQHYVQAGEGNISLSAVARLARTELAEV